MERGAVNGRLVDVAASRRGGKTRDDDHAARTMFAAHGPGGGAGGRGGRGGGGLGFGGWGDFTAELCVAIPDEGRLG
jgi:hypothetical protein